MLLKTFDQFPSEADVRLIIGRKMNMSRSMQRSNSINVEFGRNPLESFLSWVHGISQCGVLYVQSSVSWLQETPSSSRYPLSIKPLKIPTALGTCSSHISNSSETRRRILLTGLLCRRDRRDPCRICPAGPKVRPHSLHRRVPRRQIRRLCSSQESHSVHPRTRR